MRVGSPQQWVSLFPNTLASEAWVIGASGCDDSMFWRSRVVVGIYTDALNDPFANSHHLAAACISKRGGIVKTNESSTWSTIGLYSLNFQPALGVTGSADYGLDTISIGDAIRVPGQIVGVVNSTEFLLGSLGLGVIPSNFTSNNQAAFLASMVANQSAIPSHSYAYTAGAHYRKFVVSVVCKSITLPGLKGVPASLTLGGVDLNRFVPNDISFDMANGFQPVLSINAISVSSNPLTTSATKPNWTQESFALLGSSQAELFTIDSSTPFLWLPEKVCDAFAMALNLTYNDNLQLYLYGNGTDPSTLTDWNLTFTFTLADLPQSSKTVDITLPYDAFNHQLSFPFPALNATVTSPAIDYFPVRKASNNTQYTIGRVFLQESYLAVDYERNNFSVSQAKFANDAVTNVKLTSIKRPPNSIFAGPAQSSVGGLSTGAKVGIGAGIAILVMTVVGLVIFFCFRKRRGSHRDLSGSLSKKIGFLRRDANGESKPPPAEVVELLGNKRQPLEVPADQSTTRFELAGNAPVEMPAEVPSSFYITNSATSAAGRAELEHQGSTSKTSILPHMNRSSQSPSLPPYSPAHVGRRPGSDASPSSTGFDAGGPGSGTLSSGISGVSPNDASPNNLPQNSSYGMGTGGSSAQPVSSPDPSPLLPSTPSHKPWSRSNLSLPPS